MAEKKNRFAPVEEQMVFAEATTVLPLLASAAYHRGAWKDRPTRRLATLFTAD